MNETKLPQTDSIEELAHFWDTHDLTDFEDELEEVTEPVFVRRDQSVQVQLSLKMQEFETLKQLAKSRGIGQSALVREWVLEKLKAA